MVEAPVGPSVLDLEDTKHAVCVCACVAARAFPAWEWMGNARGGVKRADQRVAP